MGRQTQAAGLHAALCAGNRQTAITALRNTAAPCYRLMKVNLSISATHRARTLQFAQKVNVPRLNSRCP